MTRVAARQLTQTPPPVSHRRATTAEGATLLLILESVLVFGFVRQHRDTADLHHLVLDP